MKRRKGERSFQLELAARDATIESLCSLSLALPRIAWAFLELAPPRYSQERFFSCDL